MRWRFGGAARYGGLLLLFAAGLFLVIDSATTGATMTPERQYRARQQGQQEYARMLTLNWYAFSQEKYFKKRLSIYLLLGIYVFFKALRNYNEQYMELHCRTSRKCKVISVILALTLLLLSHRIGGQPLTVTNIASAMAIGGIIAPFGPKDYYTRRG